MIQQIGKYPVRVRGRTAEDGGMLWLASPLSEAGFSISGAKYLEAVLQADDTVAGPEAERLAPRYEVLVDGDSVIRRRMQDRTETLTVFESSSPWSTEIRIRKLSECTQSLLAVKELRTDGKIQPLEERGMKVEFIGDSITCGYGVEGKNELEDFSTATENAAKSYAGLAADWMGLDAVLTAFSGYGIVSGYTGDPEVRNTDSLLPPYYEFVGRNAFTLPSGRKLEEIPWDFSRWQPEKIVIHLGTNDLSWIGEREPRKDMFRTQYKEFLKKIRDRNPGATLLCVLGIMGTGLNETMVRAVNEYRAENGDPRIHAMTLAEQDGTLDGYGSNWHPSERTQQRLAVKIRAFLENT